MHTKEFDQLSFKYESLKEFLVNSPELGIFRLEFESHHMGESLYICSKSAVSGQLEAFVVLYFRFIYDANKWRFNLEEKYIADMLDYHILPALQSFNFDFSSDDFFINYISKLINGLKDLNHSQDLKITFSDINGVKINNELLFSLLNEISIPNSYAVLKDYFGERTILFETMDKFVLFYEWSKG